MILSPTAKCSLRLQTTRLWRGPGQHLPRLCTPGGRVGYGGGSPSRMRIEGQCSGWGWAWARLTGTPPGNVSFQMEANTLRHLLVFIFFIFCFLFFCLFAVSWAAPMAYGGSQARGRIGAAAISLHHSHSNAGSKPHLRPTPQLMAMLDP